MTGAKHKSDSEIEKNTPYLTVMGELWGVCCEDFAENWSHYNGTILYYPYHYSDEYNTA